MRDVDRRAFLIVGGVLALVGILVLATTYAEENKPYAPPPGCESGCSSSYLEVFELYYFFGFILLILGVAISLLSELFWPEQRLTRTQEELLLERIEGPPRRVD